MRDEDALVAEFRAGLEGVTPGPWHPEYRPWATGHMRFLKAGKHTIGRVESTENIGCRGDSDANLEHIARCSPENIAALLDALEAERSTRVRLEEALETARAWINDNLREGDIPGCTALAAATNALAALSQLEKSQDAGEEG